MMRAETLFTEHMDLLYRMALFMLSNTHDAEDAVQDNIRIGSYNVSDHFR